MDYDEIRTRIDNIINTPISVLSKTELIRIRKKIANMSPKSMKLAEEAKACLPGGTEHALLIKDPFPIAIDRAKGSKLIDIDGNEYIDYLCGSGAIILGHNYSPLQKEVNEVIAQTGQVHGWFSKWEIDAIKQIKKHYPSIELFRYFSSGTEACMAAIRIARVFTDKKKIIRIGGTYHGWSDQLCYDMHTPFSRHIESYGIPRSCSKHTVSVEPNNISSLELAFKKNEGKGGTAAIIIEPLGPDTGTIPIHPEYHKQARELCDQYDSLLIFDEVITGFRIDLGGAQNYFKIKPDLTTMGKALTHGYPSSGGVGGREDVMKVLVAGEEVGHKRAYTAGTLTGNPLSCSATYWTIHYLEKESAVENSAKIADLFTKKVNNLFDEYDLPFFAYNYESILHFQTYGATNIDIRKAENVAEAIKRKQSELELSMALLSEGIITKNGMEGFTSITHTKNDVDSTIAAMENILKNL